MRSSLLDGQEFEFTAEEVLASDFLSELKNDTAGPPDLAGHGHLPFSFTEMVAWRKGRQNLRDMASKKVAEGLAVCFFWLAVASLTDSLHHNERMHPSFLVG